MKNLIKYLSIFSFFVFTILSFSLSVHAASKAYANKASTNVYIVNPAVCIDVSPDDTIPEGSNKELYITMSGEDDYTYTWYVSADSSKTWTQIGSNKDIYDIQDAVYNNGVAYQYKVVVTDPDGFGVSRIINIQVTRVDQKKSGISVAVNDNSGNGDTPSATPTAEKSVTGAIRKLINPIAQSVMIIALCLLIILYVSNIKKFVDGQK